jgi:hypothetical protein
MYGRVSALTQLTLFFSISFARAQPSQAFALYPGFNVVSATNAVISLAKHSWEFGTVAEALLELYNPELSVFGNATLPVPVLNPASVQSLSYAKSKIVFGTGSNTLGNGSGAVGDPASLGVSAVLLGKTNVTYAAAAQQTMIYLTQSAPRYWNGAISQRNDTAELWYVKLDLVLDVDNILSKRADFMYMAPPFLAYYAASRCNADLLYESVLLCNQYRQILYANATGSSQGAWTHVMGTEYQDPGLWSTGNGWAAAGMTRVLAVVQYSSAARYQKWRNEAISQLTGYIQEIIDAAMNLTLPSGLLRNYLNDTTGDGHGFGEASGTTLIAASVYRMAVLAPGTFGSSYIQWADGVRGMLGNGQHFTDDGLLYPVVDPYDWQGPPITPPITYGSPEGNAFVVLMYAAWRDCVQVGIC